MILTKTIKIKPSGKSISYYKNLGYDVKWHEELEVSVSDLPDNSNCIIEAQCDYSECNGIEEIHYSKYTKNIKFNNGFFYCKKCWQKRFTNKMIELYGVDNISKLDSIKEKKCETMMRNYGVKYSLQSQEIRDRINSTCLQKYGTKNVAELESTKTKRRKTNLSKYGYENAHQAPEIKEKIRLTNLSKYGCESVSQNPEIRRKISLTMYENQSVATSIQQKYLHNLLGGELNGVVSHYNCDMVFQDEKNILEYDGGGHFLAIEFDSMTEEDFKKREMIRDKQIKAEGYKVIRIISRKDKLPSDTILLEMLSYARNFFTTNPERSWISFDIDNSCIYNAYHKEQDGGLPYDFGTLRKIKKSDLQEETEQAS